MTDASDTWYVYVVETRSGRLYTGISIDVFRRFDEHLKTYRGESKRGAKFFRLDEPLSIVYREACTSRSEASKREYQIKQMTKRQKQRLIEANQSSAP